MIICYNDTTRPIEQIDITENKEKQNFKNTADKAYTR